MYNPYQPNYFGNQQPQMQVQQTQPMQGVQQLQNNSNGVFVPVANENVAFNYPVAYGNTVIFKDENNPYIYIKKMGFSQLESPVFEKYHREDVKLPEIEPKDNGVDKTTIDGLKSKIGAITDDIEALREEVNGLKSQAKKSIKKKGDVDDD